MCVIWVVRIVENVKNDEDAVPPFLGHEERVVRSIVWDEVTLANEIDRLAHDLFGGNCCRYSARIWSGSNALLVILQGLMVPASAFRLIEMMLFARWNFHGECTKYL